MQEITIIFENNTTKNFPLNTTVYDIAEYYQKECSTDILGARINNEIVTMDIKVNKNCEMSFIDINDPYGYRMYQAALKFIFCVATKEVFPNIEVNFLHSVPKGIMIEVKGKNLFQWSMLSLKNFNEQENVKYIFIVRKEDNSKEN